MSIWAGTRYTCQTVIQCKWWRRQRRILTRISLWVGPWKAHWKSGHGAIILIESRARGLLVLIFLNSKYDLVKKK